MIDSPPLENRDQESTNSQPLFTAPDFGQTPTSPPLVTVVWKWTIPLGLGAIFLSFFTWQCGSAAYQGSALSNKAVWRFHEHLNNGEFGAICDEADEVLAQSEKRDELLDLLESVHRKLGDSGEEKLVNLRVNVTTRGTFIFARYTTTFDHGKATETFDWRKNGTTLKLCGYNVESRVFLQ
jgi:hypothetical protein